MGAPSPAETRAGQAPGAWLWVWDNKCPQNLPLLFPLSPSHPDFLLKTQLGFCQVPIWRECPHESSISSSVLLPMAVCQSGPGTFGPTRQWSALTLSVLHARPCARGCSHPWLQIQDVFIIIHSLQKRETETGCV